MVRARWEKVSASGAGFARLAPLRRLAGAMALVFLLANALSPSAVRAEETAGRRFPFSSTIIADHWELARWDNGMSVCDLYIEKAAVKKTPSFTDIRDHCTPIVYQDWLSTVVCEDALKGNPAACKGLFLRYMGAKEAVVQDYYELPTSSVHVEIDNCQPWAWCSERPRLKFVGEEPLGGFYITSVHARVGSQERSCEGATCLLRMPVTDMAVEVEYWAISSYGDESPHAFLRLRNRIPTVQPEQFFLELLAEEYNAHIPAGAVQWGLFPALDSPVARLLEQPVSSAELATDHNYLLLAGSLIRSGQVDGSSCPDGGLLPNGNATPCGQELSRASVLEWQNRYDSQIFSAAAAHGVPSRLLKGIIARETQFWPVTGSPYELGLGRITENGADLLLSWNNAYFLKTCQKVYSQAGCSAGYSQMSADQKKILRGRALTAVGSSSEIDLVAATLGASSQQVAQMMVNVTGKPVPAVTSLEDMWILSVANYHAGSGCVGGAMQATAAAKGAMTWEQVARHLEPVCQAAVDYVNQVEALGQ